MEVKPGWKTSEFWLRLAAMAVSAALASGVVPSEGPWLQLLGGAGSILSMLGYSKERLRLKSQALDTAGRGVSLRPKLDP